MAKKARLTDEEILHLVKPDIDRSRSYQDDLSAERQKAYQLYRFQPLGNERDGFSQVVDSVAWNTVEWAVPNITAVFNGDFLNITTDNEQTSKTIKELFDYYFFRRQKGHRLIRDFVREGCVYHNGIIKTYYCEEYDFEQGEIEEMGAEDFAALNELPDITVSKFDEVIEMIPNPQPPVDYLLNGGAPGAMWEPEIEHRRYQNIKVTRRKLKYAGPKSEVVPPWEFYYLPGYPDLKDNPFVAHRVKRTLDYVRKQERSGIYRKGTYKKVQEHIDNRKDSLETTAEHQLQFQVEGLNSPDDVPAQAEWDNKLQLGQNEVWVWECYINLDIDKDGLLEPCIVTICEDVVMQEPQENPYGTTFVLGAAIKEPFKAEGLPFPLLLEHEQKEQTNLRRLIVDSGAESTYRTMITPNAQQAKRWAERVMGDALIGAPDQFREVSANSPSQFSLRAYELGDSRIQNKTGLTNYNQGLDADSLNKTAAGISMVMSASQVRLKGMTINFAEAIEELVRQYIKIFMLFPPVEAMRELNLAPIDLGEDQEGRLTVEVDVGVGPQEKNVMAQHMDELVGLHIKALIPSGTSSPVHLLRTIYKKYELLGQNVKELLPPLEEVEKKMADKQMMSQLDQMIKQMGQKGVPAEQIGMKLIEVIGGHFNAQEGNGQQPGKAQQVAGANGGRRSLPQAPGQPRPQAGPGPV